MLTPIQFALLTQTSGRQLEQLDSLGVLSPHIDPETGRRGYTADQLPAATVAALASIIGADIPMAARLIERPGHTVTRRDVDDVIVAAHALSGVQLHPEDHSALRDMLAIACGVDEWKRPVEIQERDVREHHWIAFGATRSLDEPFLSIRPDPALGPDDWAEDIETFLGIVETDEGAGGLVDETVVPAGPSSETCEVLTRVPLRQEPAAATLEDLRASLGASRVTSGVAPASRSLMVTARLAPRASADPYGGYMAEPIAVPEMVALLRAAEERGRGAVTLVVRPRRSTDGTEVGMRLSVPLTDAPSP